MTPNLAKLEEKIKIGLIKIKLFDRLELYNSK